MKPCNGCTACCVLFTVPEMDKPRATPCKHLCVNGCAIHDQPRPALCTDFSCCWREEPSWGEELRPDRNKIIFMYRGCVPSIYGNPCRVYQGCMFSPYSDLRRENQRLIDRLVVGGKVILLTSVNVDEEGYDEGFSSRFNKQFFSHLSTAQLLKQCMLGNEKVVAAVNEYYAQRGGQ